MKHRISVFVLVALILAAFVLPPSASAGSIMHYRGNTADAWYFVNEGCVDTYVWVFATQGRTQNPPGPGSTSSWAEVRMSQYDWCEETLLLDMWGGLPLNGSGFQMGSKSNKLDTARLQVAFQGYDYLTGTTADGTIDLTWTVNGPVSRSVSSSHYWSPGYIVNSRYSGIWASAEVVGSVMWNGTNYTPGPWSGGSLQNARNGMVEIS